MTQKTLNGPGGIRLVLDSAQIFPDDPGQGTPAMVHVGDECGTYGAAADTGELICGKSNFFELSGAQLRWLQSEEIESAVDAFLDSEGPGA